MANYIERLPDLSSADRQIVDSWRLVGISNEVIFEKIPFPTGLRDDWHDVPYTNKFAVKIIKKHYTIEELHPFSVRLSITPKRSGVRLWHMDGTAATSYTAEYIVLPVYDSDKNFFVFEVQLADVADWNISLQVYRTYYLSLTFNEAISKIYVKTRRDNNFVEYFEDVNNLQIEQSDNIKLYAEAVEGYAVDAEWGNSPATAKTYNVNDNINYAPTASENVVLHIVVNNGVSRVNYKRSTESYYHIAVYDEDVDVGKGETFLMYSDAQSGYQINVGYATSEARPDTRTIIAETTYAPTATKRQGTYRGKCSAQILGNILQSVRYTSDGTTTDTIGPAQSGRPVVVDGYGTTWALVDAFGRKLLQGTREEQQCGHYYAHFRWLSREGAYKEHVLEIRQQKRNSEALELATMHKGFDVRKAQTYGFTAGLDNLCDYDLWYYSDIITSSEVYVNFSGVDYEYEGATAGDLDTEWQRVHVTMDEAIIYTRREDNELFVDVTFNKFGI